MMNDRVLYEMLYQFISDCINEGSAVDKIIEDPAWIWRCFFLKTSAEPTLYEEIAHLIKSIAKELDRKDKLKCQYCRVDAGFFVKTPVQPHNLCKTHLQEYEVNYIDRTLTQVHPALGDLINHTGKKLKE